MADELSDIWEELCQIHKDLKKAVEVIECRIILMSTSSELSLGPQVPDLPLPAEMLKTVLEKRSELKSMVLERFGHCPVEPCDLSKAYIRSLRESEIRSLSGVRYVRIRILQGERVYCVEISVPKPFFKTSRRGQRTLAVEGEYRLYVALDNNIEHAAIVSDLLAFTIFGGLAPLSRPQYRDEYERAL